MPHVFTLLERLPSTITAYDTATEFVKSVTLGAEMETKLEVVNRNGVVEGRLNPENYPIQFTKEVVNSILSNIT